MDIFFIYRILSWINATFGEASFDGIKGVLKYVRNLAIIVAWTTILIFMLTYIPTVGIFSCMLFNLFFTLSCGITFYALFQSGADIGVGPYILLIATILMVISSIIMCVSYNKYASKYEEKNLLINRRSVLINSGIQPVHGNCAQYTQQMWHRRLHTQ